MTSMDDPAWLDYWRRADFLGGRAQVNVQYLPYAIEHLGEAHARAMLRSAIGAAAAFG